MYAVHVVYHRKHASLGMSGGGGVQGRRKEFFKGVVLNATF